MKLRDVLFCALFFALIASAVSPTRTLADSPWFGQGCNTTYTGPGGIRAGSFSPQSLTQEQRQWLFEVFGHQGIAPDGYGGEDCSNLDTQPTQSPWFGQGCGTSYLGPGDIKAGSYSPQDLSQEQRQWLFEVFGHVGVAPDGYGGEFCDNAQPTPQPQPTETSAPSYPAWFGQGCSTAYTGPGSIKAGNYIPQDLSQEQRQWLFEVFGHEGYAPVGYGGEPCSWQAPLQPTKQAPTNNPIFPATDTSFLPLLPTSAPVFTQTPTSIINSCFSGDSVLIENGHNYVVFHTGQENFGYSNWEVTEKPWQVKVAEWITGKTMAPWAAADSAGIVNAGFPWIDWLPWNYFFAPNNFTLCKR